MESYNTHTDMLAMSPNSKTNSQAQQELTKKKKRNSTMENMSHLELYK